MARTAKEVALDVTAATIRRGDRLTVGGQVMRVRDLVSLPSGAKRIRFSTGETLSIHCGTKLTAWRVVQGW